MPMTAIIAALISHHSDRTSDSDQSHSNESQQHLRSPLLSVSRGATALELVSNSSDKHLRVRSGSLSDFFGRGNFVFKFLRTFWQQRPFSFSFISSAPTQVQRQRPTLRSCSNYISTQARTSARVFQPLQFLWQLVSGTAPTLL